MISRPLIIVLALGAGAYRLSQGAVLESIGLFGLGAGLMFLKLSVSRPKVKPLAYVAFLVTAVTVGLVLLRNSR